MAESSADYTNNCTLAVGVLYGKLLPLYDLTINHISTGMIRSEFVPHAIALICDKSETSPSDSEQFNYQCMTSWFGCIHVCMQDL